MADLSPDRSHLDPAVSRWQERGSHSPRRPQDPHHSRGDIWGRRRLLGWAALILIALGMGVAWRLWQLWGTASAAPPQIADTRGGRSVLPSVQARVQQTPGISPAGDPLTAGVGHGSRAKLPEIAPGITVPPALAPDARDVEPDWGPGLPWGRSAQPLHLLVLGTDADGLRSDVIWLARLEPGAKRLSVLQVPRDSVVAVPGGGGELPRADKIAHVHAYWDEQYTGHERAVDAVSSLLGAGVHRYLVVNMRVFTYAVDLLGGVEVDVPVDMEYDDPYQKLHIKIPKGRQVLNGEQALQVARWRQDNTGNGYGDLGRIQTQQALVQALFRKAIRPANLVRLTRAVPEFLRMMKTDLSSGELLALAGLAPQIDLADIQWYTLPGTAPDPGEPAFGFYLLDPEGIVATVERWRDSTRAGYAAREPKS